MTNVTLWAVGPQEGMGIVLKVLAVIGGAVLGGLLIGALGNLLVRAMTTRKMPVWGTRTVRLVGAVATGWLVALLVFGGGGSGIGGSGGGLFGGKRDDDTKKEEKKDSGKKDGEKEVPVEPKVVRVEVLGEKTLKLLKQSTQGAYRGFRIEDDKEKRLFDIDGLQKELRARKEKVPGLKVTLVFYKDSPDKDLNEVPQLETWLRDEKMWDQYDPTDKDSPEVKRSGS